MKYKIGFTFWEKIIAYSIIIGLTISWILSILASFSLPFLFIWLVWHFASKFW